MLEKQINLLREVSSVLFSCLRELIFIDSPTEGGPTVLHFEFIDDLIGWIMCIVC